ncbi:MAG: acylneuraminate cytidylyltransferase family protein [Betaproteobacteria bacterium]|nr:acylneuraminate cytidylyltransferase family protein [Betaproteobacteria bacterium]
MKRICSICARGGSKGVKGKNVRPLLGKPLIVYTIEQAKASEMFDVVAVSSDSDQILEIARDAGVDFAIKRPDEMATDEAGKLPAILHCVSEVEKLTGHTFQVMVDLDATSPLRIIDDIRHAVNQLEKTGAGNLITAMPSRRSPYFNLVELNEQGVVVLSKPPKKPILRRQDAPKCFDMNASIYVWRRDTFFSSKTIFNADTELYVMPEERSIDIDSELDFQFVEFVMQRRMENGSPI